MAEPFLAEIRVVPFNFPPTGWAFCNGQILPISQNSAVFSLIGTFYGGNGTSNFALPDLQGRVPIGFGQGPGLTTRTIGESGGAASVTLTGVQIPAHTHAIAASSQAATTHSPVSGYAAKSVRTAYATSPVATAAPSAIEAGGGNQAHNNLQPYLTLSFIIALNGIFPSRS